MESASMLGSEQSEFVRNFPDASILFGSATKAKRPMRTADSDSAPLQVAIPRFYGLVGQSAGMRRLYDRISAAAATTANLLIVGETGTGKELVARAIHESGPRRGRPFVVLNCAALPKDLIESELFGYKRGAFSGANNDYLGMFRAADGGTLFLDEITEMDPATQSKLLRAIQERAVRPVGSTREQPVDVRILASTNREPKAAVASGQLREDLYYRLQAYVLTVPPLRDRRADIPLLVDHFIALFKDKITKTVVGISEEAVAAMLAHSWPGNVRELCNAIEAALTFGRNQLIECGDLPAEIATPRENRSAGHEVVTWPRLETLAAMERRLIETTLQSTGGNKVEAASVLKISRKKLYAKIAKYRLADAAATPSAVDEEEI